MSIARLMQMGASGVGGDYQIERSLRFNSADTAYLNRTPASAGNRKTWTWSGWVKRSNLSGSRQGIFICAPSGSVYWGLEFDASESLTIYDSGAGGSFVTSAVYRDCASFYHIVVAVDTTQATSSNRTKLYVNGEQVTNFSIATYPTLNADTLVNSTNAHSIGSWVPAASLYFSGYLADIHFIDGQALTPSSFGEVDEVTGVWKPIRYAGTYGTNGFHLDFSDNSSTTALGYDAAGSNDWTPNNFSVTAGAGNDSLVDTPTQYGTDTGAGGEVRGNYCTLNPLSTALTGLNNGNLNSGTSGAANWKHCRSTFALDSGKWYWECLVSAAADASNGYQTGVLTASASLTGDPNSASTGFYTRQNNLKYTNGTSATYFTTTTANDILMFAFDADTGKMWNGKNGTWEVSGDPAAGTNENWSSVPAGVFPMAGSYGSSINITFNFGQRPFAYTAPSGFKAFVTTNLPDPTILQGDDHFGILTYTNSTVVTGLDFAPDFVWHKSRNQTYNHYLYDKVRGTGAKGLNSNSTATEGTNDVLGIVSFDSNGVTYSSDAGLSQTQAVGWFWKAGGAGGTSHTQGTISSTASVNTTAGISIVTYTGNGTAGATVGHGLGVAPSMVIIKQRTAAGGSLYNWNSYHIGLGVNDPEDYFIALNTTDSRIPYTVADLWSRTKPSSTVVTLGGSGGSATVVNNYSGTTYVAYCFAEVEGFSKFGSFVGNGSADGPFIYTGFRPAFVLYKASSTISSWFLNDNQRDGYNFANKDLYPEDPAAESVGGFIDILSNGFKLRTTSARNTNGATYIFMAFSSNPFKTSLAR